MLLYKKMSALNHSFLCINNNLVEPLSSRNSFYGIPYRYCDIFGLHLAIKDGDKRRK